MLAFVLEAPYSEITVASHSVLRNSGVAPRALCPVRHCPSDLQARDSDQVRSLCPCPSRDLQRSPGRLDPRVAAKVFDTRD